MTIVHIIMVGLGGFFGAIARYAVSKKLNHPTGASIPFGTLTVNLTGAFLFGVITGVQADIFILLLFGTGFLGAFTTFSTLKLEMTEFYRDHNKKILFLYTVITYGGGIVLAFLGYILGS